ncbi:MAG TPA: ATPase [Candidatus Aenigmarchaeota archaeon]|nr:ATPase [Candidatus Aenigmarchaeota archaeon]
MEELKAKTIVPDTSVLIHGVLSNMIREGKLGKVRIVIPRAVVDELQAQASRGREVGFEGLEEIKRLRDLGMEKKIKIEFIGLRPTLEEIQLAKKGRIDAIIRDVAAEEKGVLVTCDYVQALVGEAEGVPVKYIDQRILEQKMEFEKYFDRYTQSVHLKVGLPPYAKKGKPGKVELVKLGDKKLSEKEINHIINQIMYRTRRDENSFIEISKYGAMVIQMGNYRISITKPPFSSATEITIVRPIAKLSLSDYKLHKDLERRIAEGSRGILIAGPPGSGKSTFAASIADFLVEKKKIVKTFEQPRDLQVGPEVTQFAQLEGDWEKTAELLLLVRPDYTIFDEIRKTRDFRVFGDMRLAGVGMIGVIHSTYPVSAIQRFVGRLELGVIPHVIDTVIFIEAGRIRKVYELEFTVKVPSGMKEADLARPVIEVRDFETKKLEYEIYTYGEENVVMPVAGEKPSELSPLKKLAREAIYKELSRYDPGVEVEFISDDRITARVRSSCIAGLIGKSGKNIERIEKKLGLHISVEPKEGSLKNEAMWDYEETGGNIIIKLDPALVGAQVDIYRGDEYLFSAHVGKKGNIKIRKRSDLGRRVIQALASGRLRVMV